MTTKLKSPWELLSLLYKSDFPDINLTVHERALLAVIITFVNGENIAKDGYKAWPSKEMLILRSGIGDSTFDRSKNKLEKDGWITVISGRGKGSTNNYFVNADKIVAAALRNGTKTSDRPTAKNNIPPVVKEPHNRNTSGLKNKPVSNCNNDQYDDEPDGCPF